MLLKGLWSATLAQTAIIAERLCFVISNNTNLNLINKANRLILRKNNRPEPFKNTT